MAKKKKKSLGFIKDSSEDSESTFSERKLVESLASSAFQQLAALEEAAPAAPAQEQQSASNPEDQIVEMEIEDTEVQATLETSSLNDESQGEVDPDEAVLEAGPEDINEASEEDQEVMHASAESSIDEVEESDEEDSENQELADFDSTNIYTEEEPESFLPNLEASGEELPDVESVEGTELDAFESAEIEDVEFVEEEQLDSIVESVLFASDRPVSLNSLKLVFKGTNIKGDRIRRSLDRLAVELAGARRGVTLEEVPGGYQLRTKVDNLQFLTRTLKARQFKLSGPALEVLSIVAYKQPVVKNEIDEIRGVESGHLLRALMEKGLVNFEGKSDLPGKPMLYATTKKFLEIFGLRNLKELPTLSQIDELLPEGMTEEEAKPTLSQVTDTLSQTIGNSYSEGEDELMKITDQLTNINTSSEFFEQEKVRQQQKRDADKAQNLREAIAMGEAVSTRDRNWLTRYDEALMVGNLDQFQTEQKQEAAAEEKQVELDFIESENEESVPTMDEAMESAAADGVLAEEPTAPIDPAPTSEAFVEAAIADDGIFDSEHEATEVAMNLAEESPESEFELGPDDGEDHNSGEANL